MYEEKGGCGVVARELIHKDEVISVWGGARIVQEKDLDHNMESFTQRVIQVEEGLYMVGSLPLEPTDCFNHSCDPNIGFSGQLCLVAMRDIQPGEEISFDYAMCDGSSYDEFDCQCGSKNCRGTVKGSDWSLPALWEKYDGYFSPYLAKRIVKLKAKK
jgi:hypothetical protein